MIFDRGSVHEVQIFGIANSRHQNFSVTVCIVHLYRSAIRSTSPRSSGLPPLTPRMDTSLTAPDTSLQNAIEEGYAAKTSLHQKSVIPNIYLTKPIGCRLVTFLPSSCTHGMISWPWSPCRPLTLGRLEVEDRRVRSIPRRTLARKSRGMSLRIRRSVCVGRIGVLRLCWSRVRVWSRGESVERGRWRWSPIPPRFFFLVLPPLHTVVGFLAEE